jgi:DNA-binding transcriptional regulator YdaS (Cro superfamily)|tara:strand:+ start:1065 stop:1352 length:288 start_codon:yes stop_codon:yes gene_type:complete
MKRMNGEVDDPQPCPYCGRMNQNQNQTPSSALREAIRIIGGLSAVGRALGISRQSVSKWGACPAHRVLQIEELTGRKIRKSQLRPDLYPPRRRAA